jgi:omega-amidase
MDKLTLCLIQTDLFWEDPEKNRNTIGTLIDSVTEPVDLVLLPETFSTGFTMNTSQFAETMDGPSLEFIREKARQKSCMIIGSQLIAGNGLFHNRLFCVKPDGTVAHSDKRHLFRLSDEFKVMTAGKERIIVEWKGWKILPLVCFDMRFPVWARNTFSNGKYEYDLLVYVANWPASRAKIWRSLLPARAIENLAFAAAVNRIGADGHGTGHSGDSMVAGPDGTVLADAGSYAASVKIVRIDKRELESFREKYPFGYDWDTFRLV